jgi:hypothetical protein
MGGAKAKPRAPEPIPGIAPTAERMARGSIAVADLPKIGRTYTDHETRWIDRYKQRGKLGHSARENAVLHDVATKYLALASIAYASDGRSTLGNLTGWSGEPGNGNININRVDAMDQLRNVNKAVGKPGAAILMAVVYFDQSTTEYMEGIYRGRGWDSPDRRLGLHLLRDALWRAGRFWRLL